MFKPTKDFYQDQDISDLVPASEKAEAPYLIAMADSLISRLVVGRPDLRRLRDMYEGRRSPEAFKHLTDNYGIGNPGRVPFIPIVRNRIEYLKGQYLTAGIPHQIACSDSYSIGVLQQERMEFFMKELTKRLTSDLGTRVQQASQGEQPAPPAMLTQNELKRLHEEGESFQSSLEIAAQRILTDYLENPELRTVPLMQDHLENLLVEKETAFYTKPGEPGTLAKHEVVKAGELYCDIARRQRTSEGATCFVRRQIMSVQQALMLYGHDMVKEERRTVAGNHCIAGPWESIPLGAEKYLDFYRVEGGPPVLATDEYRNWVSYHDDTRSGNNVEVFTVQWIATNEVDLDEVDEVPAAVRDLRIAPELIARGTAHHLEDANPNVSKKKKNTRFRQDLYEVVRVGSNCYVHMGKVENPVRPVNEPWRVQPTFRRYSLDISLLEMCADIQDKSDIMHYFAENLGATAGTKGSVVPVNDIPHELGPDIMSRIRASQGYRKLGKELINPMQAGGTKGQFSNYQSFDDSLNGQALDGIKSFLEFHEESVSSVTGVNRQMLGSIAERDAVRNTQQAVTQGTVVTRPIFALFDILMGEAFTDMLNLSRQSIHAARNGTTTRLMLGESGRYIFTVNADQFSSAYFRVYVRDGQAEKKQLESMVQLATEFAKSNILPPEEAIETLFAKSVTATRQRLTNRLREGTASKMQQLQQQNEELQKKVQELSAQVDGKAQTDQQVAIKDMQLEEQRVGIEAGRANTEARQGDEELDLKAQEVALQRDQALAAASSQAEKVTSI